MANEPYITKKDFSNITQKVVIENSRALSDPLIDEQKKDALKRLEEKVDSAKKYDNLLKVITNIVPTLLKGLFSFSKGLLKSPKSIFSFIFKIIKAFLLFAGIVGVFDAAVSTFRKTVKAFKTFGKILNFLSFKKLGKMRVVKYVIDRIKAIGEFFRKIGKTIKAIGLKKLRAAGNTVFGIFKKIGNFFKSLVKAARKYNKIFGIFRNIGRILGKVFLPLTILIGIFDFVKGFMRGYSEDGIIGGIKEGFNSLFDGLVGGLLRLLTMIPSKIAEWLGFEELANQITENTEVIIESIKDAFGGIVDLVKGIFMWDTEKIMEGLTKVWNSIVNVVMIPFNTIKALVTDVFGGSTFERMKLTLKQIGLTIQSFFLFLQQGIASLLDKIPDFFLKKSAIKFIDDLNEGTRILKNNVDAEISNIKDMKAELKKKDELEKKLKLEEERAKSNTGGISTGDSNASINTTNNVTYIVQNGNSIAGDALSAAGS